jgi:glycosyltransferase involved in cell wall biosynthesis
MLVLSHYPNDPRVKREAEALAAAGIEVDVFCLRTPEQPESERFGRVTAHRLLCAGKGDKESLPAYLRLSVRFMLAAYRALRAHARTRRYAVLQVHNLPDYLILPALPFALRGVPLILDLHDLMTELYASKWAEGRARALLFLVRGVEAVCWKCADALITTSEGFRRCMRARGVGPGRVTLVLNSADERIFRPRARDFRRIERDARLLYHGTVAHRFGLHVLLDAVKELQASVPGTTLRVHGNYDPSYLQFLKERTASLGLERLVAWEGYRPLEELVHIFTTADIGVVPYLRDPFMEIALSTKTFEYVATGLPVAASRLPSLTSMFDERALAYFAPGDARELARRVTSLCEAPEARRAQCERAFAAYGEVAWPVMRARYLALVTRLAGARAFSTRP